MEDNIIKIGNFTAIMNGGNPLNDCPTDYDKADEWAKKANEESEGEWERPQWSFDCGFKLDFDGPIIRVSSRFYPPKTHYGETWDGSVTVFIFDKEVSNKEFDCKTLEELKTEVEKYTNELRTKVEGIFNV